MDDYHLSKTINSKYISKRKYKVYVSKQKKIDFK